MIKLIKDMSDNERFKTVEIGNFKDDKNPSKVKIQKYGLSAKSNMLSNSTDSSGEIINSKLLVETLKTGLVEIDNIKADKEIIDSLSEYPFLEIFNAIQDFNDESATEEVAKN